MSEQIEELMTGYVLHSLSPDEVEAFEELLRTQPDLIVQLDHLQEVMGLLAYAPPSAQPSPELRSRIRAIAQDTPRAPRRLRWPIGTMTAVGVVAVGFGLDNYHLRQQLADLNQQVAHLKEEAEESYVYSFVVKGTAAAQTSLGSVFLDIRTGKAQIVADNLLPLPEGEAYALWAITKRNRKIFCGQFNVSESGQVVAQMAIDPAQYTDEITVVRVSRESSASPSPSAPAAPVVLMMTSEL